MLADARALLFTLAVITSAPACRDRDDPARGRELSGAIVYASSRDDRGEVWRVDPATARAERVLAAPDESLVPLSGSPLVAVATRDEAGAHVEMLVGAGHARLAPASGRARSPSFAPDKSWLVYESDRESFRDLFRVDLATGAIRRLTDDREGNFEPEVSPDGARIAFSSSRDGNSEIYVMDASGEGETRLTAFHRDDWRPRWSPDGKTLAFESDREGPGLIFLMRPDGSGVRRLTDAELSGEARETDLRWSPDGTRIAYAVRGPGGASALWIADLRTGRQTRISPAGARDAQPSWSPDGRHLAFSGGDGAEPDLYIARADGTERTRLTTTAGADWQPTWIAESRRPRPTHGNDTNLHRRLKLKLKLLFN